MKHFLIATLALISLLTANCQNKLSIVNLKCEYDNNPLGIETQSPRLSWQMQSSLRGQSQSAYQIIVSDDSLILKKNKGNVWDSKKIKSSQSIQVEYAGTQLSAAKKYYWKVRIWNQDGKSADWSPMAYWQMGLLSKPDWGDAAWITMPELNISNYKGLDDKAILEKVKNIAPQFRKDVRISKPIKSATAFISGLGHFEMFLNGQKVGDHFLDPGWTNYEKYALYVTFDITHQLLVGDNTLGIMLGNGFYTIPKGRYRKAQLTTLHGLPKTICKILVEYTDGSSNLIVTDNTWKASRSPITYGTIYGGEDYDATLEQDGWMKPGFDASTWANAVAVKGNDTILSQRTAPLKVMQKLLPKAVFKTSKGWVYDMGQNMSGIVQLTTTGLRGKSLKMYPAELLKADSTSNQTATGSPYVFGYTLKGKGIETWQPQFSYTGYRYVMVEGAVPEGQANPDTLPVIIQLQGLHTRNSAPYIGSFWCSNELFNKTNTLIDWAVRSNMASVLTDCPHREKLGWLEQTHLMGGSLQYYIDIAQLYTKTIADMRAVQWPTNGFIPTIAPEYCVFNDKDGKPSIFRDSPEWNSAYIIDCWYMYQWYGDKRLISENYEFMKRFLLYLNSKAKDGIIAYGLGDWYDLGPNRPGFAQLTSLGLTSTSIWYYDVVLLTKMAEILGKTDDAQELAQLSERIKTALNKKFYKKGVYDTGSQCANAMALYVGAVDPKNKASVLDSLIADIRSRKNALTAGDVGYRYVLRTLEAGGASNVIFDMNNRSDVPGYGYQLKKGATALTESWQALPNVSNNHLMLGHIMEWFYSGLGGIRQADTSVAYKQIIISPEPVGNVTEAKTSFNSPYGLIKTEWKKQDKTFELNVEIPANTTAEVYLPKGDIASVSENGSTVDKVKEMQFIRRENGKSIYRILSGSYSIKAQYYK